MHTQCTSICAHVLGRHSFLYPVWKTYSDVVTYASVTMNGLFQTVWVSANRSRPADLTHCRHWGMFQITSTPNVRCKIDVDIALYIPILLLECRGKSPVRAARNNFPPHARTMLVLELPLVAEKQATRGRVACWGMLARCTHSWWLEQLFTCQTTYIGR